jgi:hypothetical protein
MIFEYAIIIAGTAVRRGESDYFSVAVSIIKGTMFLSKYDSIREAHFIISLGNCIWRRVHPWLQQIVFFKVRLFGAAAMSRCAIRMIMSDLR